jgi:hypothetical protein
MIDLSEEDEPQATAEEDKGGNLEPVTQSDESVDNNQNASDAEESSNEENFESQATDEENDDVEEERTQSNRSVFDNQQPSVEEESNSDDEVIVYPRSRLVLESQITYD